MFWTSVDIENTWVRASTARNVVGIAIAAVSSGTSASSEPNTTASTTRAPTPASRVSISTLLPEL